MWPVCSNNPQANKEQDELFLKKLEEKELDDTEYYENMSCYTEKDFSDLTKLQNLSSHRKTSYNSLIKQEHLLYPKRLGGNKKSKQVEQQPISSMTKRSGLKRKRKTKLTNDDDNDNESLMTTVSNETDYSKKPKRKQPSPSSFALSTVPKRGLKLMAVTICDAVQGHGSTTYAQLAQDIALVLGIPLPAGSELKNDPNMAVLEKNIRRRVYDCLNVLIAIGVIEKTGGGRYLQWVGRANVPTNESTTTYDTTLKKIEIVNANNSGCHSSMTAQLSSQLEQKRKNVEAKRETFEMLCKQESAFQRLIERNRKLSKETCDADSKIELPFILVRTPLSSEIFLETTEDQTMMKFKFTEIFHLHGDAEIVTGLESLEPNDWRQQTSKSESNSESTSQQRNKENNCLTCAEKQLLCGKENVPVLAQETVSAYQM
eukprot:jgi/Galph1/4261/GphlegSOOS_G2900.1